MGGHIEYVTQNGVTTYIASAQSVGSVLINLRQGQQMQMPNCYVLGNFFGPNNDAGNRALVVNYQNNTLNPLVNTNQINIEGFINHHLNTLLNGSWRDL